MHGFKAVKEEEPSIEFLNQRDTCVFVIIGDTIQPFIHDDDLYFMKLGLVDIIKSFWVGLLFVILALFIFSKFA